VSGTFGAAAAMAEDTIDKDVQSWERIAAAVAFRKPNGDELLIARKVVCPNCGNMYLLGLADRDTVSYARRHPRCEVNNTMGQLEDEDNG
jgi:hypothetical protein